jgi:hypothetical protein
MIIILYRELLSLENKLIFIRCQGKKAPGPEGLEAGEKPPLCSPISSISSSQQDQS